MIGYDLFIKKDPADLLPKVEDEEVDISDEVRQFQPILIEKDERPNDRKQKPSVQKDSGKAKNKSSDSSTSDGATGSVTFDDEVSNRKSLSDTGPKEASDDEKKRIRELVALKRQELLAEQMADETESPKEVENTESEKAKPVGTSEAKASKENVSTENQNGISGLKTEEDNKPKPSVPKKPELPKQATPKQERQTQPALQKVKETKKPKENKVEKPYKPPKIRMVKPEKPRPELVSFEFLSVEIDEDARKTKLCGAKTAEKVHEDFNSLPLDEILKHTAGMAKLIKDRKSKRPLGEDEIAAIERSKAQNRPDPVSFRDAT